MLVKTRVKGRLLLSTNYLKFPTKWKKILMQP